MMRSDHLSSTIAAMLGGAHLLAASSQLAPARSQMAFTLGFHIILASVGVAFPAIMLIANYRGLRRTVTIRTRCCSRSAGRRSSR